MSAKPQAVRKIDFAHRQRARFSYHGELVLKKEGIPLCGFGSQLMPGTTVSSYAGIYHFPNNHSDINVGYKGMFMLYSESANLPPLPVPLPKPFNKTGVGVGVGVDFNLFASVDPNVRTFGVVPSAPDLFNVGWGASMGIHLSGGVSRTPSWLLPISVSFMYLNYTMEGMWYEYPDYASMISDIENGTNSEVPAIASTLDPILKLMRDSAVLRIQAQVASK